MVQGMNFVLTLSGCCRAPCHDSFAPVGAHRLEVPVLARVPLGARCLEAPIFARDLLHEPVETFSDYKSLPICTKMYRPRGKFMNLSLSEVPFLGVCT